MAPIEKPSARASTPSTKPSVLDGPKSPEKSRVNNLQKPPVRGIPPKKPSTLTRSPPSASTHDRPRSNTATSTVKRPTSSATAPTSSSARKTSTAPLSPRATAHARTGVKVGLTRQESRLKDGKDSNIQPANDTNDERQHDVPSGEKGVLNAAETREPAMTRKDWELKDAEIARLQQQVQRLEDTHARETEDARAEIEALRSANSSEHQKTMQAKEQELEQLKVSIHSLEEKILAAREDKDREIASMVQQHEEDLADKASKHQQELRDVIAGNDDRAKEIRARHVQELDENTAVHRRLMGEVGKRQEQELCEAVARVEQTLQEERSTSAQERENILSKHRQELEVLSGQEKSSGEIALRHQEEIRELQKVHEQNLEDADSRHAQQLKKAALLHKQQFDEACQERQELQEKISKLEQEMENNSMRHKEELDKTTTTYKAEIDAATSKLDTLQERIQRHQDQEKDTSQRFDREIKQTRERYEKQNEEMALINKRELEKMVSSHKGEYADVASKHEQTVRDISSKLEAKTEEASSLRAVLEKADLERNSADSNLSVKYEQDLKAASAKYERELGNLCDDKTALTEQLHMLRAALEDAKGMHEEELKRLTSSCEQKLEDQARRYEKDMHGQSIKHGQEFSKLREQYKSAASEAEKLQTNIKDLESLHTETARQAVSDHEKQLQEMAAKHEEELIRLRNEHQAVHAQMAPLNIRIEAAEDEKSKAIADLYLKFERDLETIRKERDDAIALKAKSDSNQKLADLEEKDLVSSAQQLRRALDTKAAEHEELLAKHKGVSKEVAELKALLEKTESADDDGKANDMVVTYKQEVRQLREQHMGAVKELAKAQQTLKNLTQERDEASQKAASHEAALNHLKENHAQAIKALSTQHQEALDQVRSDHEATLTKLSALQIEQVAVLKELESLKQSSLAEREATKEPPANTDQLHADLRKYMATLKRQYGTDVADLEALKKDIDAEGEKREEAWRKQEEMRAVIAAELEKLLVDSE
ncbi:MAG: hypothetical protein Q9217_002536 [Psora testacea]